jgi:hypothetical protein
MGSEDLRPSYLPLCPEHCTITTFIRVSISPSYPMEQSPSRSSSSSHSTPNHCGSPFQPSHCRSPSPVNEPFELSPRLRRDLLVYTLDSSLIFSCIFAIRSSFRLNLPESLSPGSSLGLPSCYSSASSYTSNIDHISSLERDFVRGYHFS